MTNSDSTTQPLARCPVCRQDQFTSCIDTPAHMSDKKKVFHFDQCTSCQAIFLNPRLKEELLYEYYQESYLPYRGAKAWGKYASIVQNSLNQTDRKKIGFCKKALPINEKTQILDLGCGQPSFLEKLHQNTGCQATGLDFSTEGWKNKADWYGIELIEGDIKTFQPTRSFDLITMWHYLEHDYSPAQTLQKLQTMLKPGGKMIIEVPDSGSLSRKIQGKYWEGWHAPRHTVLYNPESLSFLLENNGWEVEKIYRHGTIDAFTLWWMGRQEKHGIDWSDAMERHFWPLVFHKVWTAPLFLFEKWLPFGVMLFVVKKKD